MASDLTSSFEQSRVHLTGKELEEARHNYFIEANMRGNDEASIGGLNINTSGRTLSDSIEAKKRKQTADDLLFLALLDDMRDRLDALEASMERRFQTLQEKYGEDVIGGIADTYLTDEEKAGLETDQEKLEALANKFLNPDGSIKDEYRHLEEAKYIRDWQEAQNLQEIIAKYEGRNTLEPDEKLDIYNAAKTSSLADNKNMVSISDNSAFKLIVDRALETRRTASEGVVDAIPSINV